MPRASCHLALSEVAACENPYIVHGGFLQLYILLICVRGLDPLAYKTAILKVEKEVVNEFK